MTGDFEMAFRRAFAVLGAFALMTAISTPSFGQDYPQTQRPDDVQRPTQRPANQGQAQNPERKKLSKDELAAYDAMNALVNNVVAGKQPAPSDVKLTWHNHFLKSNNNVYVPYTVDVEPGKFAGPVVMYIRVVSKDPAAISAAAAKAKSNARGGDSTYAFEDVYFLPSLSGGTSLTSTATTQTTTTGNAASSTTTSTTTVNSGGVQTTAANTVERAMELPAGDYDVFIAMAERPKDKKAQATAKTVVFTQPLTVPSTGTALTTSSIILAKSIDQATAQLTGQQQLEQPYTISGYKITPRFTPNIPKTEELVFVFFIYNEGVAASGKPELDVDYNFFRATEEKPFSKLATTSFNASTLPGEFDVSKGHQVFVGQGIPLTSFVPGDYKLEIKINDKTNSSTVTRSVPFTVAQ
jgi:hypothetical protein